MHCPEVQCLMTETYPQKITFDAMLEMSVRDVLPLI
jgi:hypothetical protein